MKLFAAISGFLALLFGFTIVLYFVSPVMDEWIIKHSLQRFCKNQKETFAGEEYSPAYLCTFVDPIP